MTRLEKIQQCIREAQARDQFSSKLFERIRAALVPFDGKPISKRLATAAQKQLPEYTVYYRAEYGMFHLSIWGAGIEYNDRREFLLGYDSTSAFIIGAAEDDKGSFYGHNRWAWSAALERIQQCQAQLADTRTLQRLADAYEAKAQAERTIAEIQSYPFEAQYAIERAMEGSK